MQSNVNPAMTRIYNRLAQLITTEYCRLLEDDMILPFNVVVRMLKVFDHDVASVAAPQRSWSHTGFVSWDRNSSETTCYTEMLGLRHFDQEFYLRLPATVRRLLDWSCECDHLEKPQFSETD